MVLICGGFSREAQPRFNCLNYALFSMYIQENDFVRKMKTFSNSVALPFSSFGPLTNWREEIWRLEIMLESEPRVEQIACTVDFVPSQKNASRLHKYGTGARFSKLDRILAMRMVKI